VIQQRAEITSAHRNEQYQRKSFEGNSGEYCEASTAEFPVISCFRLGAILFQKGENTGE